MNARASAVYMHCVRSWWWCWLSAWFLLDRCRRRGGRNVMSSFLHKQLTCNFSCLECSSIFGGCSLHMCFRQTLSQFDTPTRTTFSLQPSRKFFLWYFKNYRHFHSAFYMSIKAGGWKFTLSLSLPVVIVTFVINTAATRLNICHFSGFSGPPRAVVSLGRAVSYFLQVLVLRRRFSSHAALCLCLPEKPPDLTHPAVKSLQPPENLNTNCQVSTNTCPHTPVRPLCLLCHHPFIFQTQSLSNIASTSKAQSSRCLQFAVVSCPSQQLRQGASCTNRERKAAFTF